MMSESLIAIGVLTGLVFLLAVILAIASRKLYVYEDPRIDQVEELLPHANCGACGEPGCRAFAEKVVEGKENPARCTVSAPEEIEKIAYLLGIEATAEEKQVARLLCAGGRREAQNLSNYRGSLASCRAETVVAGGPKSCAWGCLGLGDCADVCDFDAIHMNEDGLPQVDPEKCTACGDCVDICPKDLFELMPVSHKLIVQCKSLLQGEDAEEKCSVACTACRRCVADADPGLIEIRDNLAVINYDLNELADPKATWRCPTDAIVWLEGVQFQRDQPDWLPLGRVHKSEEPT